MRSRLAGMACWTVPLVLCITGCSRDLDIPGLPPPATGGAITGRMVVEDSTGTKVPASEGRIELLRRSDRIEPTDDGLFVLLPPEGAWQALFRDGCDAATGICEKQRLVSSVDLPLVPGVDLSLGDVVLSSNGDARGRVVLSDQPSGLAGGIAVYVPGSPFRTETGPDGSFKLSYLPEGTMTVAAFVDGYEPVAIPAVRIGAGTTTTLADITLDPVTGTPKEGSITGSAARADGAGTVTVKVLRGADLMEVASQDRDSGESFVFAGLAYGFYTLTAEAESYGKKVVNSILLTDAPVAQPDVDLGEITIEEMVFEQPSTGGEDVVAGSCKSPAEERGPCIVSASPPSETALPPFGVVRLQTDERIVGGSAGVVFRPSLGDPVAGEVLDVLDADATNPDAGSVVVARPRRPLTTGFWTATLSSETRDLDGNPPPGSSRSWIVTGLSVAPAIVGTPPAAEPSGGSLGPALAVDGNTVYLAYRDQVPESGDRYMVAIFPPGAAPAPVSIFSQASLDLAPRPRAIRSGLDGYPLGMAYDVCPAAGDAPFAVSLIDLRKAPLTKKIGSDGIPCGDVTAMTNEDPLVGLVGRMASQQIGIVRLDPQTARVTSSTAAAGFSPEALEVANVGGNTYLAARDGAGHLRVAEVGTGTLTAMPEVAAETGNATIEGNPAVCDASGKLLVLYVEGGAVKALLRDPDWRLLPDPLEGADAVACRTIGDVPVVVTRENGRLFAQYYRDDPSGVDEGGWIRWMNAAEADGALNDGTSGCEPEPEIAITEDPDAGALVAWSEACPGAAAPTARRVDLRRLR